MKDEPVRSGRLDLDKQAGSEAHDRDAVRVAQVGDSNPSGVSLLEHSDLALETESDPVTKPWALEPFYQVWTGSIRGWSYANRIGASSLGTDSG